MNFSCWYINVYINLTELKICAGVEATLYFSLFLYVLTTQRLYRITADPLPAVGTRLVFTVSFKCVLISILTSVHANSFVCRVIPLQLPTTVSFKCVLISINFSAC